jgi:hypothetical protein
VGEELAEEPPELGIGEQLERRGSDLFPLLAGDRLRTFSSQLLAHPELRSAATKLAEAYPDPTDAPPP